jgi:diacylglycerol kinase family enzyme
LFLGGLDKVAEYGRVSGTRITVTAETPLEVHRDGDPVEASHRIEVELVPRALDVVVPAATVADPEGPFTAGG